MQNILPLFTKIEKNNCFSIHTPSDLNDICRRKPSKNSCVENVQAAQSMRESVYRSRRGRQRERHETTISLVKRGEIIVLHVRHAFSTKSCGTLHNNDVKSPNLRIFESIILYFYFETARTNLFLGYFAHIVRREGDGLTARNL